MKATMLGGLLKLRKNLECTPMSDRLDSQSDGTSHRWREVFITVWRLLTFQASRDELTHLNRRHLVVGMLCTWIVGVGRYWDNPRVQLLQRLGIGSIIYVFIFAFILWVVLHPLRPKRCSYFRILIFISLVSPPAILYAIPVEHFFSLDTA